MKKTSEKGKNGFFNFQIEYFKNKNRLPQKRIETSMREIDEDSFFQIESDPVDKINSIQLIESSPTLQHNKSKQKIEIEIFKSSPILNRHSYTSSKTNNNAMTLMNNNNINDININNTNNNNANISNDKNTSSSIKSQNMTTQSSIHQNINASQERSITEENKKIIKSSFRANIQKYINNYSK